MDKTREFLQYFNRIENYMQQLPGVHNRMSFAQLVRYGAKQNYVIRREMELLDDLRQLRNVMVHEAGNKIIAVPSDEALEALKCIADALTAPVKVYDLIGHKIITMNCREDLAKALKIMKKHEISQIPVYGEGTFKGLLTGNAIARWITANMDGEDDIDISINDVRLEEVLVFCERRDDVVFLNKSIDVNEALTVMADQPSPSGIYLMTQNGHPHEKPIGIITNAEYRMLDEKSRM